MQMSVLVTWKVTDITQFWTKPNLNTFPFKPKTLNPYTQELELGLKSELKYNSGGYF